MSISAPRPYNEHLDTVVGWATAEYVKSASHLNTALYQCSREYCVGKHDGRPVIPGEHLRHTAQTSARYDHAEILPNSASLYEHIRNSLASTRPSLQNCAGRHPLALRKQIKRTLNAHPIRQVKGFNGRHPSHRELRLLNIYHARQRR